MKKYEIEEIQKHKPKYKQMIFVQRPFGIEIEVGNIKTNPVKTSSFSETIYDGTHNLFPNRQHLLKNPPSM